MEKQVKFMFTCVIPLMTIIQLASGGEYCCQYFTSNGTFTDNFYCSKYCCGTSTSKYCCTSSYRRYYPSFSSSWLCSTVTKGEYCCPYYTSYGSYESSFHCTKYCCGTSTNKYCCTSEYVRYYPSHSTLSSCPTPSNVPSPSSPVAFIGAIVGSVVGFIALCVIIGVVICCATGCCGQRRGTVARGPGNAAVYTTATVGQGYPVGFSPPPPNTGYGPGIPPPTTGLGPGLAPNSGPGVYAPDALSGSSHAEPPPLYPGRDFAYPPTPYPPPPYPPTGAAYPPPS